MSEKYNLKELGYSQDAFYEIERHDVFTINTSEEHDMSLDRIYISEDGLVTKEVIVDGEVIYRASFIKEEIIAITDKIFERDPEDHLSELKNKLERNKDNRNTALKRYHEADQAISENELKFQRKAAMLLKSERMELASYREIIKGSVDRLNHQQHTNNEYLAELNHNLTDMSDLKAIYETKREIMEQNHQELVTTLKDKENRLKRKISILQDTNKELMKNIVE